jgi:uncharacterized protein involved in type VI secretion and phage assembly
MLGDTGFYSGNLLKDGIRKLFGKYRGLVSNVNDPLKQGRIKAKIPELLGKHDCNWALPCVHFAGDTHGFQTLPEIGDGVWIEFEGGDPNKPIWVGFWWKPETLPSSLDGEYNVKRRYLWVPGNMFIEFDSNSGDERIRIKHNKDTEINMNKSGDVLVKANGQTITLKYSGDIMVNASKNVSVTAGGNATVNASGNVNISAGGTAVVSATGAATVSSSVSASISAPSVTLAGGGSPIARVGDSVSVSCVEHGSHTGIITGGSYRGGCG